MKTETSGGVLRDDPGLKNISTALESVACRLPDKVAMSGPDPEGGYRSVTYRELSEMVNDLAGAILERRSEPVVGITGDNSIRWAVTYLAALRAGGTVVPVDRELPIHEMLTILHYSGANMMFFDERYAGDLTERLAGKDIDLVVMNSTGNVDIITHDELVNEGRNGTAELPSEYDPEKPAAICYTSGTTGYAKGVVLSRGNLIANIRQVSQVLEIFESDIFLSILPVHHTFEGTCGFLFPLTHGASIYISRGIHHLAEDMKNSGATVLLAVPLLWEAMYRKIYSAIHSMPGGTFKYRLGLAISRLAEVFGGDGVRRKVFSGVHDRLGGAIRFCISGGAGIAPEIVDGFMKLGFVFLQGYGLTETSPIVSVNTLERNRVGSVGPAVPGMTVRIDSPGKGGVGELVVRGPNVMKGYYMNPDATARVLSPDGWFRTGDFGYIDDDGFIFITGRRKNVIVSKNGKNVYPEEIELILGRDEFVLECMVTGKKSETKGEEIWLIVVPDKDRFIALAEAEGFQLTADYMVEHFRRLVKEFNASQPTYKRIARFIVREQEFPKTTTRKVKRREVLKEAGLETEVSHEV